MLLNSPIPTLALVVFFVWLVILTIFLYRLFAHYRKLTQGITKKDLKTVLDNIVKQLDQDEKTIDSLTQKADTLKKDNFSSLQKIGLVRFNPFAETGGNQSFSLAALDGHGSGFVLSGLHSRETTRVYAKPINQEKAVSGYELSSEEKQAVKRAKRSKK